MYSLLGGIGGLQALLAVVCIVHAVRRNNNNWIYLILFFPIVGPLAYLFAEVLPDLRRRSGMIPSGDQLISLVKPSRRIEKLKAEVAFSNSITNRQLLAQEYMNCGRNAEAIPLFESCLEGVHADDPAMIHDLARALFMNGDFRPAREKLLLITQPDTKLKRLEARLLLARANEELGDVAVSCEDFRKLLPLFSGEEVRCRYALLLKKLGRNGEAAALFQEIIANSQRNPRYYQRLQKHWIGIAKANLARQSLK